MEAILLGIETILLTILTAIISGVTSGLLISYFLCKTIYKYMEEKKNED